MINKILKYIFTFFVIMITQVTVFQNIHLGNFIIMFPYVILIIILPIDLNKNIMLLIAFLLGLIMDMFFNTMGVHALACICLAFTRYHLLNFMLPRKDSFRSGLINSSSIGRSTFYSYTAICILTHQTVFFYIDIFRIDEFFITLLKIIISSFFTYVIVILLQYLITNNNTYNKR